MKADLSQFCESAVFVFGSNRQGIHGASAARWAVTYRGALVGHGIPMEVCQNSPQCFACSRAAVQGAVKRRYCSRADHSEF